MQAGQQFLEQNAHFHLGHVLAKAEMRAIPKTQMAVRIAVHAEGFRRVEYILVTVAGQVTKHQPIALADLAAHAFGIFRRRAHEMLYGRHPPHALFNQPGDQRRVSLQLCEFGWEFAQRAHGAGGAG